MSSVMRAAMLVAPKQFEIVALPLPEPAPDQVRLRLEGCGVCASNIEPWEGQPWSVFPGEPGGMGHEGWGSVDAVGSGVRGISPGDRVAALSSRAFATHELVPGSAVTRLPRILDGKPMPGEPIGCAMNIFKRSEIAAGHSVAIIGIGFLGAILTQLASAAGARVIGISRRQSSLELAARFGASETIVMDDHQRIIDEVGRLTDGQLCDRVIECVGRQWPLDLAGELIGFGGRLVVAGYHQDGPRQVNMQMWNWKGIDVINAHERDPAICRRGLESAVAAVAGGRIDPSPLYTHRFPLECLGNAIAATRDKPQGFVKAWIAYD